MFEVGVMTGEVARLEDEDGVSDVGGPYEVGDVPLPCLGAFGVLLDARPNPRMFDIHEDIFVSCKSPATLCAFLLHVPPSYCCSKSYSRRELRES